MKFVHRDSQLVQYVGGLKPFFSAKGRESQTAQTQASINKELFAAQQLLEEISNKELTIALDQKCSKILENALYFVSEGIQSTTPQNSERNSNEAGESDELAQEGQKINLVEVYIEFYKRIMKKAPELTISQYSSHVLQTLFTLLPTVYTASVKDKNILYQVRMLPQLYLDGIKDQFSDISKVFCDSCGSHVIRSFILACTGYTPTLSTDKIGHRYSRAKKSNQCEALPSTHVDIPAEFSSCFQEIYTDLSLALSHNGLEFSTDAYAAPILIILMKILSDLKLDDQLDEFIETILALKTPPQVGNSLGTLDNKNQDPPSVASNLSESPTGSNLLESILDYLSPEKLHLLLNKWLLPNINIIARDQYGNFIIQKVLQSHLLNNFNFKELLQCIDLTSCLESRHTAIIWKFAVACRRLQVYHKILLKKLFKAFNLHETDKRPLTWFCLLAMKDSDDPSFDTLKNYISQKSPSNSDSINQRLDAETGSNTITIPAFHPSGYSLLFCLMKFPTELVPQLISTFKFFMKAIRLDSKMPGPSSFFLNMTKDKTGSHFLQSLVAAESPLPAHFIDKLVKQFKGSFQDMSLHPTSGFVLTSFYKSATVETKTLISSELIEIKDQLKRTNYPVYKICEVNKFVEDREKWTSEQSAKSKPRQMFKNILSADIGSNHKIQPDNSNDFGKRLSTWKNKITSEQSDPMINDGSIGIKSTDSEKNHIQEPDLLTEAVLMSIEGTAQKSQHSKSAKKRRKIEKKKLNDLLEEN